MPEGITPKTSHFLYQLTEISRDEYITQLAKSCDDIVVNLMGGEKDSEGGIESDGGIAAFNGANDTQSPPTERQAAAKKEFMRIHAYHDRILGNHNVRDPLVHLSFLYINGD